MSPTTTRAMASGSDALEILARLWCRAEGNDPDDTISDAGHTVLDAVLSGQDRKALAAIRQAEADLHAALAAPAPVVPEGLRALSEAATPGTLYTVDQPWGDGTWIVAGNPDPHKGFAVADCTGMFDRENERLDAPEAIRDVGAADDAAFLAAAANHVRTLLAATPSKPVGDGGEASAPPAGGGADPWAALRKIAELRWSDAGEPFDDALDIADKSLAAAPAAPEPAAGGDGLSQAARDVLAERRRQVEVEGWTPEHDDRHNERELGLAAACYASAVSPTYLDPKWSLPRAVRLWPWDEAWWKPSSYRRNLVKAGALILAEIDRLDRAAEPTPANTGAEGGQA